MVDPEQIERELLGEPTVRSSSSMDHDLQFFSKFRTGHKYEIRLGFVAFIRKAVPFAVMQIVLALAYVLIVLG